MPPVRFQTTAGLPFVVGGIGLPGTVAVGDVWGNGLLAPGVDVDNGVDSDAQPPENASRSNIRTGKIRERMQNSFLL
jgi:hypothetical protein